MIQCLRVDYRLLHGQTALAWTQSLGADCILIANDALMRDDIQKATLKLAKPSGVKLVMKNIEDSIAAINSGVTDKYRLFILVKTIEDAWKLAEGADRIRARQCGRRCTEAGYPYADQISSGDERGRGNTEENDRGRAGGGDPPGAGRQ